MKHILKILALGSLVGGLFLIAAPASAQEEEPAPTVVKGKPGDDGLIPVEFVYDPSRRERNTLEVVNLAGEFNGWDAFATELKKHDDHTFRVTMKLAPGTYQWKLLLNEEWVQNMETIAKRCEPMPATFVADPYGGKNAELIVEAE